MIRQCIVLSLLCLSLGLVQPAQAEFTKEQFAEATLFFNNVLKDTKNPLIANLAQQSLSRLQEGQETLPLPMKRTQVEIPLLTQLSNTLAVPAMINHKAVGTFLVDTGATYTVITPELARQLGIEVTAHTPRIRIATANGIVEAPVVVLHQVSLGGIEVNEVTAVIQSLSSNSMLSGLLGMNVFKDMELTIRPDRLILGLN